MPANSESQRKLMGTALSMKRGQTPKSGHAGELADSMSEKDLEDFASKSDDVKITKSLGELRRFLGSL